MIKRNGAGGPRTRPLHGRAGQTDQGSAGASIPHVGALGGAGAPASPVVTGGGPATGFSGISELEQSKLVGGFDLEPPDQALCVGNGFVIEGVNQAFKFFDVRGKALTPAIGLAAFFNQPGPKALPTASAFMSDPRCIYDATTGRFFLLSLEVDQVGVTFSRAHNVFAVSQTSNPTGKWYLYSFDNTDDGQNGTPSHLTCNLGCFGDQPLMGADANGFYISDNEYSDTEVLPIGLPPAIGPLANTIFTLPDYRSGQAQLYAMSKAALVSGNLGPLVQIDSAKTPIPPGSPRGAIWSSLQPAHSPPSDLTPASSTGVEYFMSQLDFAVPPASLGTGDNRIAVWALTNTASLNSPNPTLALHNKVISTINPADTYAAPATADQKDGPHPLSSSCIPSSCGLAKLTGNDDRMNEVMYTNGQLWGAVNTMLPAARPSASGPLGDPRVGIMYFEVQPTVSNGHLAATMTRDGYVQAAGENVFYPSIAASPRGPVTMSFTLTGKDYYPSAAWTRLDPAAPDNAIHVSGAGVAPEDGFTAWCHDPVTGSIFLNDPTNGQLGCGSGATRWGDYSFSVVDESGCIWTADEYIPGGARSSAANWGTFITHIQPSECLAPRPASVQGVTTVVNAGAGATQLPLTSAPSPWLWAIGLGLLIIGVCATVISRRLSRR